MSEGESESDISFGWDEATKLIRPVTPVPANFSATIRTLAAAYDQGAIILQPGAQTHLMRLINTTVVKAVYYYATKLYRPSILQSGKLVTARSFLNGYTPIEHATLLTYCYYFHTLAKRCEPEEWEYVQGPIYESLTAGAHLGDSIPEIGLAFGLLSRGLRFAAFATFHLNNKKAFREYRRYLRSKDLPFDTNREREIWGCSNIQIAALFLQAAGFNTVMTRQFVAAADRDPSTEPDQLYGVRFRIAELFLDHYMEHGDLPNKLPEWVGMDFSISSNQRDDMVKGISQALTGSQKIEWLGKGGSNINPQSTPELFQASTPETEMETGVATEAVAEVPEASEAT